MDAESANEAVDDALENDDETSQVSSIGDFSASEDEWIPAKDEQKKGAETSANRKGKEKPTKIPIGPARVSRRIAAKKGIILPEEPDNQEPVSVSTPDGSASEDESDSEKLKKPPKKAKRKPPARSKMKSVERKKTLASDEPIKLTTFTVEELYRKYRPDLAHPARPSTSKGQTVVPPPKRRKPNPESGEDGLGNESDSSGDDHLVDPSELDLNSDFFRPSEQEKEQRQAVDLYFDCNAGVELTDSETEETDAGDQIECDTTGTATESKNQMLADAELGKKLIQQINQSSKAYMQMVNLAQAATARATKDANPDAGSSKTKITLNDRQQEDIDRLLVAGEKLTTREGKGLTVGFGRTDFVKVTPTNQPKQSDGPKEIEITLPIAPDANGKAASSKRTFDVLTALKRFMNREKRNSQLHVHKVTLLCWIGHGTYVNSALRKPSLMRFAQKKLLPGVMGQTSRVSRPNGLTNVRYFQELTRYYRRTVTLKDDTMFYRQRQHPPLGKFLIFAIAKKVTYCRRDYILLFVLMLRILGVHARLIISPPVPPKHLPSDQLYRMNPKSPQEMAMERKLLQDFRLAPRDSMVYVAKQKLRALIAKQRDASQTGKGKRRPTGFSIPQLDGGTDDRIVAQEKNKKVKLMTGSFLKVESNRTIQPQKTDTDTATETDDQSVTDEVQKRRERILAAYRARAAKLAAKKEAQTDGAEDAKKKSKKTNGKMGVDYWVEVFCEHEDKWITIDVLNGDVYKLENIVKQATQPIVYVLAWNNDGTIKDVSPRYISRLGSKKSKLRVEDAWLEKALRPYRGKRTKRDLIEDVKFDRLLNKRPFPEQIGEYKNHPKYAIERYLLRNEAIYPPDAPVLGYIREEPIYLRDCVHTLHSRESWLRQAKTVRLYEPPYKVVKAKAKYDRFTGAAITGQTVELFGEWQVKDYEPPVAKDGLVPRSAYGNVDLFQPCMLPKGTVHLQLPGLNRICRRLRIDCAQAITGFEYRSGGCQAVYDGFVVCEEFRDRVLDEWYQEQVELQEKEDERRRKRIYANWRRLIMGLCIRKKLKDRYNFDNM